MKIGKSVWHSPRVDEANSETLSYKEPTEIITRPNYFTVMKAITRGFFEVLKYGETAENTWTVIANSSVFDGKFKVGDLMWVDGESPFSEKNIDLELKYGHGCTANAVIKNVAEVNTTISITLYTNQNKIDR